MAIAVGATAIEAVYVGGTAASAVYLGATQVWSAGQPVAVEFTATADASFGTGRLVHLSAAASATFGVAAAAVAVSFTAEGSASFTLPVPAMAAVSFTADGAAIFAVSPPAMAAVAFTATATFAATTSVPLLLPTYVGRGTFIGLPESSGNAITLPTGTVTGDYVLAWALGTGVGSVSWSGTGWTSLVNVNTTAGTAIVYGKFVVEGDTTFTPTGTGLTGCAGLLVYRDVTDVHPDTATTTGTTDTTVTFPAAWASQGVGSMAMIFDGEMVLGDYPVHSTLPGWRRDVDARRWNYGGAAYATFDPALWTGTRRILASNVGHAYAAVMLRGASDAEGTLSSHLPSTTRPTLVSSGDLGYNADLTVPAAAQAGDLIVIVSYRSATTPFFLGDNDDNWWGLVYHQANGNNFAQAQGRFVVTGEPGVKLLKLTKTSGQAHGWLLLRGVHEISPLTRSCAYGEANSLTFGDITAGTNTILMASMGANLGSAVPNLVSASGWTTTQEFNTWPPWGAAMVRTVTDDEVVSGLGWDVEGTTYALGEIVELRGYGTEVTS